ncbi:MAG: DUF456 domain-containing protein, partial [Planctomycetota bacterium]
MVEVLLALLGLALQIVGIIGCVVPVMPGPPINWFGVLLLRFALPDPPSWTMIAVLGAAAVGVTVLDYVVPARGAKKAGATRWGVWGSIFGMVVGILWFPPLGLIVGAFVGAVAGELIANRTTGESLRAGKGVLLGTLLGMLLKFAVSGVISFYVVVLMIDQLETLVT